MSPRTYPIGTTFPLVFICWAERSRVRHKVHAPTGTVLGSECPYCFCAQNTNPLGCSFQTSKCSFCNFPAHTPLLPSASCLCKSRHPSILHSKSWSRVISLFPETQEEKKTGPKLSKRTIICLRHGNKLHNSISNLALGEGLTWDV